MRTTIRRKRRIEVIVSFFFFFIRRRRCKYASFLLLNIGESVGGGANGVGVFCLFVRRIFWKLNSAEDGVCGSSSFTSSSRSIVAFDVFFSFFVRAAFRAEVFMMSLLFSSVNACEIVFARRDHVKKNIRLLTTTTKTRRRTRRASGKLDI